MHSSKHVLKIVLKLKYLLNLYYSSDSDSDDEIAESVNSVNIEDLKSPQDEFLKIAYVFFTGNSSFYESVFKKVGVKEIDPLLEYDDAHEHFIELGNSKDYHLIVLENDSENKMDEKIYEKLICQGLDKQKIWKVSSDIIDKSEHIKNILDLAKQNYKRDAE